MFTVLILVGLFSISAGCNETQTTPLPGPADLPVQDASTVDDGDGIPDTSDMPEVLSDTPPAAETFDAADTELDGLLDDAGPDVAPDPSVCGDGVVEGLEACDDGNDAGSDWCSADCTALVDVSTYAAFEAHRSFGTLTASNGLCALTYTLVDLEAQPVQALDAFFDRIYKHYDEATPAIDYLFDAYFGLRRDGTSDASGWMNQVTPTEAGYLAGTGVMRLVRKTADFEVTTYWFAPFHAPGGGTVDSRILVGLAQVTNVGPTATDSGVFSLWNFHLGGEGDSAGETVSWNPGTTTLSETRGTTRLVYKNLVEAGAAFSADNGGDANNPWSLLADGQLYADYAEPETSDDIAVGLMNAVAEWPAGQTRWFGGAMIFGDGIPQSALEAQLTSFVAGRDPQAILAAEAVWWENWHAVEAPPDELSADELAVYRQSTAVLKMGQCREDTLTGCASGKCAGQILASLIPGIWNVSWVRDAAYAVVGLVRSGHAPEARLALEFMLQADMVPAGGSGGNFYQEQYISSKDISEGVWGLGVALSADYAISVTRHWGSGLEESDTNAAGPNIEWDNWGLFLWAFAEYVNTTGDEAFLNQWWATATTRVANLLVELIEPETGLLYPDSSIWERHWCPHGSCDEPDTRKRHAYSTIMAIVGLRAMAKLATNQGNEAFTVVYDQAADTLTTGLLTHLRVTPAGTGQPALAGNLEELPFEVFYLDLAVVEAIVHGVVAPGSVEAFGTVAAFDEYLRIGAHSPGYMRNDDPTWYDQQEWVVMDLRTVSALVQMGQTNAARTLLDWVTGQARANFDLIGELLSDGTYQPGGEDERWEPGQDAGGDYQGATPMCGFGPGAYITALHDLY